MTSPVTPDPAGPRLERDQPSAPQAQDSRNPAWSEDLALARAALAGEPAALETFVRRMSCIPRILDALAKRSAAFRSPEERRELAQEVFARVWAKLPGFVGHATLETWVYRFCALTLVERLRARRREPGDAHELLAALAADEPRRLAAPDALRVQAAVAGLDADEAAIVEARHFDGATFEEAAARLQISPNTAKTRYYRAIERLRRELRRSFADDVQAPRGAPDPRTTSA
ncbi:MAG: sigma-70 family RNA polymerase sigma factor [Planctomycetes bacterium]|nr:sigma-70 family RNA polymerase sigma factor [Planctomycetota bacterium]